MPEAVRLADSALHAAARGRRGAAAPTRDPARLRRHDARRARRPRRRGGVELAIVGGLVLDPVLGVRRTTHRRSPAAASSRSAAPATPTHGRRRRRARPRDRGARRGRPHRHARARSTRTCTGSRRRSRDAALAGGVTTMVIQDYGPVWNLGTNPAAGLRRDLGGARGPARSTPPRWSAPRPRDPAPVEAALRAGGAGLKIHEDVGAGPPQLRTALDVADRHDVQLAIHTDGLNEALSRPRTRSPSSTGARSTPSTSRAAAAGTRPTSSSSPAREHVVCSSTNPTVPFGAASPRPSPGAWSRRSTSRARASAHGDLTARAPAGARRHDGRGGRPARPRRDPRC